MPALPPGVRDDNDSIPKLSRMQIDLMVNSFAADFAATDALNLLATAVPGAVLCLDVEHHVFDRCLLGRLKLRCVRGVLVVLRREGPERVTAPDDVEQ